MDGLIDRLGCQEGSGAGRVLVVDDEAGLRNELAAALQLSGFQAMAAPGTDEALAALASNPDVAVVLSDIRMPRRSGLALAEHVLASQPAGRAVEVVLMSGHAGVDEAIAAVRAGAFDLLRKPFRLAEVAATVGRAMARAHTRRGAALAARQARLEQEALCLVAPVGLGRIGRDLCFSGANPVLMEMLGITDGTRIGDLWAQQPGLRGTLAPVLDRILGSGTGQPATCVRVELPDRRSVTVAGPRVLDLRLYAMPDIEDPSRVGAVGLACLDVTTEAALMRELDHRVRNTFAVFLGLVHAAARHAAGRDAVSVTSDLAGRVVALSRAHELVRPAVAGLPGIEPAQGTSMRILAGTVLAPHTAGGDASRIILRGPETTLDPRAAPGLALVLHELATNALKHGALSAPGGRVELTWSSCADVLTLDWREAGGPPLAGPPARGGFGLRLIGRPGPGDAQLRTMLDWSQQTGVQATITLPNTPA